MSPRRIAVLAAVVLVAGILAVPRLLPDRERPAPPAAAPAGPPALPVSVVEVKPRALAERLATTGTVRANERVDVVSEIAGVVESILFEEGAGVERGELLVKIDDAALQAQRDRASYRLKLAGIREARWRELRDQGVISAQEYDVASNELAVLQAELRLVEVQLEKTEIRAPFAGVVGLRRISEGSLVSPQTMITTLQSLDPIKIDFTVPEKYSGRIHPGDQVRFQVKGSESSVLARVYAVEPNIDPETRSLTVRARTPNPEGVLVPGAFADVDLQVGLVEGALAVPSMALIPELGGAKVFVVEEGLAQPRQVETGIRTESEVQITSGLSPGDRVIVSAIQRLRPGLAVQPAGAGGARAGEAAAP